MYCRLNSNCTGELYLTTLHLAVHLSCPEMAKLLLQNWAAEDKPQLHHGKSNRHPSVKLRVLLSFFFFLCGAVTQTSLRVRPSEIMSPSYHIHENYRKITNYDAIVYCYPVYSLPFLSQFTKQQ